MYTRVRLYDNNGKFSLFYDDDSNYDDWYDYCLFELRHGFIIGFTISIITI